MQEAQVSAERFRPISSGRYQLCDLSFAKEQAENANQRLVGSNATLSEAMQEAQVSAERFRSLCASSPIGIFQTEVNDSSRQYLEAFRTGLAAEQKRRWS